MKKFTGFIVLIGLLALLIIVTIFAILASATTYRSEVDQDYGFYRTVVIDSNKTMSYVNKTLNITIGDTVIWRNDATPDWPLTIISEQGLWNNTSAKLRWNYDKFGYTFNESGTYTFHIKEYPRLQQKIIVIPTETPISTATLIVTQTPIVIQTADKTPTIVPTETPIKTTQGFDIIVIIETISLVYILRRKHK